MHFLIYTASFLLITFQGFSQDVAILSGSVTSLNGAALHKAHIMVEPWNDDLLFNSQKVGVHPDGHFKISIPQPGLYRVSVRGVLHKRLQFPLWIREPDTLHISIQLDPKNLDDGQYFGSDEYISWIRVTGNFNGYNYDKGVRFKRVDPKTLSATITTSLDTIRYQIVGITSGTVVLPGADKYELRDPNNYEGIVSVKNNTVVLTYHADSTYYPNKNPYKGYRTTWDPNQTHFTFSDELEEVIHKNLDSIHYFARLFNYKIFDSDSLPADKFEVSMTLINEKLSDRHIKKLNEVEKRLQNNRKRGHKHYLQSLYYKYLLLVDNLNTTQQQSRELLHSDLNLQDHINLKIVKASMKAIPASSPLWSLRSRLIGIYSDLLGYTPPVISYLEQTVLKHPDNNVTGSLLFHLFTWSYDTGGSSNCTKKYYQYILSQFGDNYYARKAREYVQRDE